MEMATELREGLKRILRVGKEGNEMDKKRNKIKEDLRTKD